MADNFTGKGVFRYYSSVTARQVEWLWYPYIPCGKITVIEAIPATANLLSYYRVLPD